MRAFSGLCGLLLGLGAGVAMAQGPVLAPVPFNSCPSAKPLRLVWIANEIASDAVAAAAGPGFAETMIVCHSTEKTGGSSIDVWVEYFDFGGLPAGTGFVCGVPAGNTASFVTFGPGLILAPYAGTPAPPALPLVPMGSVRIMATKPKIACDVTVFDTSNAFLGFPPPLWSKDVTVTKAKAPQKGD